MPGTHLPRITSRWSAAALVTVLTLSYAPRVLVRLLAVAGGLSLLATLVAALWG